MADLQMVLDVQKLNRTILCYAETIYRFNGLWEGPDPLTPLISLFLIQLTFSMFLIHLLHLLLKPFKQPLFLAEIIGGILLGPSALGRITAYRKFMFPSYSFRILEPMAHLSITYYAFLVGLKMDIKAILRTGSKPAKIAAAGTVIPFLAGSGLYFTFKSNLDYKAGFIFWGAALTVTGFSVLTKILDARQLLHTDIGKTAATAALINDLCGWGFLALSFAFTSGNAPWAVVSMGAYVLICMYAVRPALGRIIEKTPEGQGHSEFYLCAIVSGMAMSSVVTDACGTHPMIGAFIFGLLIPNEVLEATIVDRLEDFVMGILMPVYVVVCGLRTNIDVVTDRSSWLVVVLLIVIVSSVKVFSCLIAGVFSNFTFKDAVAIGLLGNAKSLMVLFILEAGQIQGVLNTQAYSLMVLSAVVMTLMVTPVAIWFRPVKNTVPYKRRTIQSGKLGEELRVLTCIYNTSNVPAVINILNTSNSAENSPIAAFALQLIELVGRATTTTMVVHSSRKAGHRNPNSVEAQADQIITAFHNYELRSEGVTTQVITARCTYNTMDGNVCGVAKEKHAAFIIVPFHRQITAEGEMEDFNPSIRNVNECILATAPCSVGILIDRGAAESHEHATNIAVLYFGGPDDREALAYAWRTVGGDANAKLTVVRFLSSAKASDRIPTEEQIEGSHVSLHIDYDREKLIDDDYLGTFRASTANNSSISYLELVLNDEEEAIKAIKSMDEQKHDLYLVGRGRGMLSPLTSGLADWCDCPELGPIGDLLLTSEFESKFSVLVVQQYMKAANEAMEESSSYNYGEEIPTGHARSDSDGFEALGSFRKWSRDG